MPLWWKGRGEKILKGLETNVSSPCRGGKALKTYPRCVSGIIERKVIKKEKKKLETCRNASRGSIVRKKRLETHVSSPCGERERIFLKKYTRRVRNASRGDRVNKIKILKGLETRVRRALCRGGIA